MSTRQPKCGECFWKWKVGTPQESPSEVALGVECPDPSREFSLYICDIIASHSEEHGVRLVSRGCDPFLNLEQAPSFTTQAKRWVPNFQNDPVNLMEQGN